MANATDPRIWTDWQNDLLVADYFDMFGRLKAGEKINRAERKRELEKLTGKTARSIESKRMNVSGVLLELKMDRMPGFAPYTRFQRSLVDAVERYLDGHPEWVAENDKPVHVDTAVILNERPPPPRGEGTDTVKPVLKRIARKYDYAARDCRNRSLGRLGEEIVFNHERRRLCEAGYSQLADKVEWTARDKGDGVGYDILSFRTDGAPRKIEVKATNGPRTTPFFLTRTEREVSLEEPNVWRLYRLHDLGTTPGLFRLKPPLEPAITLTPEIWRAAF